MLVRLFLIVLAIVVLIVIVQKYNASQQRDQAEQFHNYGSSYDTGIGGSGSSSSSSHSSASSECSPPVTTNVQEQVRDEVKAVQNLQNAGDSTTKFFDDFETSFGASDSCFPRDRLTAEDLLPSDAVNTKWSQVNPRGKGSFKDANFLQSGYHIGLNTSQGSKRNGNLQIRSEPPNSKAVVSPWLNSDYEPDLLRKPLELGENSW